MLQSQKLTCCLRGDQEKLRAAQVPVVAGNLLDESANLLDESAQVKHIYWWEQLASFQGQYLECHICSLLTVSSPPTAKIFYVNFFLSSRPFLPVLIVWDRITPSFHLYPHLEDIYRLRSCCPWSFALPDSINLASLLSHLMSYDLLVLTSVFFPHFVFPCISSVLSKQWGNMFPNYCSDVFSAIMAFYFFIL